MGLFRKDGGPEKSFNTERRNEASAEDPRKAVVDLLGTTDRELERSVRDYMERTPISLLKYAQSEISNCPDSEVGRKAELAEMINKAMREYFFDQKLITTTKEGRKLPKLEEGQKMSEVYNQEIDRMLDLVIDREGAIEALDELETFIFGTDNDIMFRSPSLAILEQARKGFENCSEEELEEKILIARDVISAIAYYHKTRASQFRDDSFSWR